MFDEATSALDNESEHEISQAIEILSGTKTILIIAHRLSTVMKCDKIFYIQKGQIVDQGSFAELCEKNPAFSRMRLWEPSKHSRCWRWKFGAKRLRTKQYEARHI